MSNWRFLFWTITTQFLYSFDKSFKNLFIFQYHMPLLEPVNSSLLLFRLHPKKLCHYPYSSSHSISPYKNVGNSELVLIPTLLHHYHNIYYSSKSTIAALNMPFSEKKPSVIFVLGGPGSGKGTQCKFISEAYNYNHISAGDCLREEMDNPNSTNKNLISSLIKEGKIVPAEITIQLLKNRMMQLGWSRSKFLIDGFPRNQENLNAWKKIMNSDVCVQFCLFLDCDLQELRKRLITRGISSGRTDDLESIIDKRFKTYTEDTFPIIELFTELKKCRHVNANGSKLEVWNNVKAIFDQLHPLH